MTGLGAVDSGGVPISIASAAQPVHPHQDSSNGLHYPLQRALGPDLGSNRNTVLSVLCRKPLLSPTAYRLPPTLLRI
jgi:hypothetical protein